MDLVNEIKNFYLTENDPINWSAFLISILDKNRPRGNIRLLNMLHKELLGPSITYDMLLVPLLNCVPLFFRNNAIDQVIIWPSITQHPNHVLVKLNQLNNAAFLVVRGMHNKINHNRVASCINVECSCQKSIPMLLLDNINWIRHLLGIIISSRCQGSGLHSSELCICSNAANSQSGIVR